MTDFTRSRAALAEWEEGKPARDRLWATIGSEVEITDAMNVEDEAAKKVKLAFYEDTKHINSLEDVMNIHVQDIKRVTEVKK